MFKRLFSTKPNEFISTDISLLLLRFGAGGLILTHGLPKIIRIMDGNLAFADPIGLGPELSLFLAAFTEGILSLFVIVGLATRISAALIAFTMAVAAFFQHADDPFSSKEKALLFLILFGFLMISGGGVYSMDNRIKKEMKLR